MSLTQREKKTLSYILEGQTQRLEQAILYKECYAKYTSKGKIDKRYSGVSELRELRGERLVCRAIARKLELHL